MAKLPKPVRFTEYFKIPAAKWSELGLFDPSLNIDTPLFIDPMLLESSSNTTIRAQGPKLYRAHFATVVKFLSKSKAPNDVAWRSAVRQLRFPEVRGTCLGYGAATTAGYAFGPVKSARVLHTAKEIIDLGIDDPDLFVSMALFEEDIGPDLISDMITTVIMPALIQLNQDIARRLRLPTQKLKIAGKATSLVANPLVRNTPVLLVPKDILRDLPIARDWDSIKEAAEANQALRDKVNQSIAKTWMAAVRAQDKKDLRENLLRTRGAFAQFLDALKRVPKIAYDLPGDPQGLVFWRDLFERVLIDEPLKIEKPKARKLNELSNVVTIIIKQFAHLIEDRNYWRDLYHHGHRRPEQAAQRMFYAVAYAYCDANNLDITPEADTGRGPVDFKFSRGKKFRHLVEVKLTSNPQLVKGFTTQLNLYARGEQTKRSTYVVIHVGSEGKKLARLNRIVQTTKGPIPEIVHIDGTPKKSASKA